MPPSETKSLRLRFKGDKTERKKKSSSSSSHKHKHRRADPASSRGEGFDSDPPDDNEQAWVAVERITDLAGPAFIYQSSEASSSSDTSLQRQNVCIALNTTRGQVEPQVVEDTHLADTAISPSEMQRAALDVDGATIVTDGEVQASGKAATPDDVTQVWVATRVLDTPSTAPRYTLRSSEARFLTAEPNGNISAYSEARGPLEEWTLVRVSSDDGAGHSAPGFALRGRHGSLLGLDMLAGGRRILRCDVTCPEPEATAKGAIQTLATDAAARWHIMVQWKYRHEARRKELKIAPLRAQDPTFSVQQRR